MTTGPVAEVRLAALKPLLAEIECAGLYWLSNDERIRWSSMGSEVRRNQFLGGHWLVRRLAADALGGEPAQWLLGAEPDGALLLKSPALHSELRVSASLSHSGDCLVAALATFPVGVDLERESRPRDLLALAAAIFSPEECIELRNLPEGERAAVFYLYWTLKESTGKREGHGLRPKLARQQRPVACAADRAEVVSWQFADCSLALAGEVGMSVRAAGLPETALALYWRIETARI